MKLSHAKVQVDSTGIVERSQSKVMMNAVAFKILSSGLYSDKIGAVLREIGCNAADAHVMQGTPDRPIEIKLPTPLDPSFYIKDWGPGLSHDDVMQNYQTYFHSSKTSSNDVTGCFGLGSKSPYAYADQFTVKSAQDGVMRTYFCAFDETGVPTTSLVSESPAPDDWPHGVEVSLPVAASDQAQFAAKASEIFRWFRVPPTVRGGKVEPVTYEWKIGRFAKPNGYLVYPHLVMGNVAYRFDHNAVAHALAAHNREHYNSLLHWMWQEDIAFEVPIGTVDVTASRESIEYTPRTIKALLVLFAEEIEKIAAKVLGLIDATATWTTGTITSLITQLTEGGDLSVVKDLESLIAMSLPTDKSEIFSECLRGWVEVDGWDKLQREYTDAQKVPPHGTVWTWDSNNRDRRRTSVFNGTLAVDGKTIVLVNDAPKRAGDRIMEFMRSDKNIRLIVLVHRDAGEWQRIPPVLDANKIRVEYSLVSSLPLPPKKVRTAPVTPATRGDARKVDVIDFDKDITHIGFDPNDSMSVRDIPLHERLYVIRDAGGWGQRYINVGQRARFRNANTLYSALKTLRQKQFPVPQYLAVVTESRAKALKLEVAFGFESLDSWMKRVLDKDPRVDMFNKEVRLQQHVRFYSSDITNVTTSLFNVLRNNSRLWPSIEAALQGTTFLQELLAVAAEFDAAKNNIAMARQQNGQGHEEALRTLGYSGQNAKYEELNFNAKLTELQAKYRELDALGAQIPSHGGTYRFYLKALALAVTPDVSDTTLAVKEI